MRSQLTKIALTAIAANFVTSMAFAANIPGYCTEEIVALSRGSGFDMQKFIGSLPPAVAKAKLQAKAPFGKPKDSDKTDIGMTFGCLKAFPESPVEIASLLKDIGLGAAKNAVANQLYANGQEPQPQGFATQLQAQPQQVEPQYQPQYQPQEIQPQYIYQPPQVQPQYQPQYQPQEIQPQYIYQPPQVQPQYIYPPPQVQYVYLPQPVQQVQCPQPMPEGSFSTGQRWGTWVLNTILPGLGSAAIMKDYFGMGIQIGLTALGIISIAGLGWEYRYDDYGYGGDEYQYPTPFLLIGMGMLGVNAIFNAIRSATYVDPDSYQNSYSSNKRSGFNLAVLPNRHGEFMPYLMYNKAF